MAMGAFEKSSLSGSFASVALRALLAEQPDWSRRRLALELCRRWQWRPAAVRIKDMAARSNFFILLNSPLDDRHPAQPKPACKERSNEAHR